MPLVSILIPAYNAAPWIAETIESALTQTWEDKEVIVVDDGSTDDTLSIARGYESRGVRVFGQENQGASATRNRAWTESRGDWLQFLDADDLLAPDKITQQMELAQNLGTDFAYCSRWSRFTHTVAEADQSPQPLCRNSDPIDWLKMKLRDNVMMHPAAWLVSRSLADQAGKWDTSLTLDDDGEFFSRIVLTSSGVRHCDQAQTFYRSDLGASLSGSRSPQAWASAFASLQLTTNRLLVIDSSVEIRIAIANAYQQLAYAMYPDEPQLVIRCEKLVHKFGGSAIQPGGGRIFSALNHLFGWKLPRRIQRWRANLLR